MNFELAGNFPKRADREQVENESTPIDIPIRQRQQPVLDFLVFLVRHVAQFSITFQLAWGGSWNNSLPFEIFIYNIPLAVSTLLDLPGYCQTANGPQCINVYDCDACDVIFTVNRGRAHTMCGGVNGLVNKLFFSTVHFGIGARTLLPSRSAT